MSTDDQGKRAETPISETSLADARAVLRDADRWRATAQRWTEIDHLLAALLAEDDLPALDPEAPDSLPLAA